MTPARDDPGRGFLCSFGFRLGRRGTKTTKEYAKDKNILRCYAMGMGIESISSAFEISRNTVRKYVRKYQESGLSLEKLLSMSEDHLQEMFVADFGDDHPGISAITTHLS